MKKRNRENVRGSNTWKMMRKQSVLNWIEECETGTSRYSGKTKLKYLDGDLILCERHGKDDLLSNKDTTVDVILR